MVGSLPFPHGHVAEPLAGLIDACFDRNFAFELVRYLRLDLRLQIQTDLAAVVLSYDEGVRDLRSISPNSLKSADLTH